MPTFIVYTYGGGQAVWEALNAVATVMGGADYLGLIKIFLVLAALWVAAELALHQTMNWHWIFMFMVMFNIFFVPKETVVIVDRFDPAATRTVANVPFGLAAPAWIFSTVGDGLTRLVDKVFSVPGDLKYSTNGMVFGSRLMTSIISARFDDPLLNSNLVMYAKQCMFMNIAYGFYTINQVYHSNNLMNLVLDPVHNSYIRGMFYTDNKGRSTYLSCASAAIMLRASITPVVNGMISSMANVVFSHTGQSAAMDRAHLLSAIPAAYGFLAGITSSAQQDVTQAAMANYVENSYGKVAAMMGNPSASIAWSTAVAERQQRNSYRTMATLAEKTLPIMQTLFRVLIYSTFFIVFLALMLPITVSGKALITYFKMFIWIETWPILYAILNMVIGVYSKIYTHAVQDPTMGTISIAAMHSMASVNSDLAIIAGYLSLSIPLLSWLLVTSGGYAATQLATSIFSPGTQAANQVGGEMSRGNVSTGNLSAGNTSIMQGQSAPNMNTAGSITDGYGKQTVGPGGRSVSTSSISDIGITREATTNVGRTISTSLNQATSAATHDATSFGTAQNHLATTAHEYANDVFKSGTSAQKEAVMNATGGSRNFSTTTDVAAKASKVTGMSQDKTNDILNYVQAYGGGEIPLIGGIVAGAKATGTSKADLKQAATALHEGGFDKQYKDAVTTEHKLAHVAETSNDAGHRTAASDRLVDAATQSTISENKLSADLSKVKSLENTETFLSSKSQATKQNMNQAVKDFAGKKGFPVNRMSPEQRGELAADTRGEEFAQFVNERFGGHAGLYANTHLAPGQVTASSAVVSNFGKNHGLNNEETRELFTHASDKGYTPKSLIMREAMASDDFKGAAASYNHNKAIEDRENPNNITIQHQHDADHVASKAAATPALTSGQGAARKAEKLTGSLPGQSIKMKTAEAKAEKDLGNINLGEINTKVARDNLKSDVGHTSTNTAQVALGNASPVMQEIARDLNVSFPVTGNTVGDKPPPEDPDPRPPTGSWPKNKD